MTGYSLVGPAAGAGVGGPSTRHDLPTGDIVVGRDSVRDKHKNNSNKMRMGIPSKEEVRSTDTSWPLCFCGFVWKMEEGNIVAPGDGRRSRVRLHRFRGSSNMIYCRRFGGFANSHIVTGERVIFWDTYENSMWILNTGQVYHGMHDVSFHDSVVLHVLCRYTIPHCLLILFFF